MNETKVVTGLPYDVDLMINRIQNEGAIVDVSKVAFPGVDTIQKQVRTALIYLRNTGFANVSLDFSKVSGDDLEAWLVGYITSDIVVDLPQVNELWLYVIVYYLTKINYSDFFDNESFDKIITNQKSLIEQLINFYGSLPIFLIKRLDCQYISFDETEVCDNETFGRNAYNILNLENINDLLSIIDIDHPIDFTNHFVLSNNELFDKVVTRTHYNSVLYGLVNDTDNFKVLCDKLEECATNE